MSATDEIVVSAPAEAVTLITLNRPDHMNTMTPTLLESMLNVLEEVAMDPRCRVVIVTGAGRAFCAGGDLRRGPGGAVAGNPPVSSQMQRLRRYMRTSELLHAMPQVTIAAINGACAGAGLSWACATDVRIASENARFATGFRNAGLSGDFGGTWLLPRIVGSGPARDLYLRGQTISAQRAYELGLVGEVVPSSSSVVDRALEIAMDIAGAPPLAVRGIKLNLNESMHLDFHSMLEIEARRHSTLAASQDAAEAAAAFIEKRPGAWVGA